MSFTVSTDPGPFDQRVIIDRVHNGYIVRFKELDAGNEEYQKTLVYEDVPDTHDAFVALVSDLAEILEITGTDKKGRIFHAGTKKPK